jgi:RimJ/RimL family protein N-acetyltransferase
MENEPIDIDGLTILETGALRSGARYDIVVLNPDHSRHIEALHDATVKSLTPEQSEFMIPKSHEYIEHHMAKGGGNGALGVVCNGRLIAQILIYHPTAADVGVVLANPPANVAAEDITVLGGACVDVAYRGNGLMNRLVDKWLDYSASHGRTHAAADIDIHNTASWAAFIRGGLSLETLMTDPRDGGSVYMAHEEVAKAQRLRLTPEFNRHAAAPGVDVDGGDYDRQKVLMDSGYNAVAWDRAGHTMLFKQLRPQSP